LQSGEEKWVREGEKGLPDGCCARNGSKSEGDFGEQKEKEQAGERDLQSGAEFEARVVDGPACEAIGGCEDEREGGGFTATLA
jgi:hypothetical protein